MNYKHVWVRKKDDFDRDFRLLGKGGDFSEVRYKVPEEKIIDFEVRGPAAGRAIIREQADRLIMEEVRMVEYHEAATVYRSNLACPSCISIQPFLRLLRSPLFAGHEGIRNREGEEGQGEGREG